MDVPLEQTLVFRDGDLTVSISVDTGDEEKDYALSEILLETATAYANSQLRHLNNFVKDFGGEYVDGDRSEGKKTYRADFGEQYMELGIAIRTYSPVDMDAVLAFLARRITPELFHEAGQLVTQEALTTAMAAAGYDEVARQLATERLMGIIGFGHEN